MTTPPQESPRRVELYDTTLRDGTQGVGVTLSLVDKLKITSALDAVGIDFIEGGYPLSNPKDQAYFEQVRDLPLKHAKICAFGMTRRKGIATEDDPGMQAMARAGAPMLAIVGKTWDVQVDQVLRVSREENLAMIRESLAFCAAVDTTELVSYDAEHFFDGYKANPDYALQTLKAALKGGAARLVLCDTNGGSMPDWVQQVIGEVRAALGADVKLCFHNHNDCGLAVANSLVAVRAGCVQVQGTINGIGERCGNVDLTTVAANLKLKLGYDCLTDGAVGKLTELSRLVYELANVNLAPNQPYVGSAAFAHKGGMHVHAIQRLPFSYEHVTPESVGNERRILVSELSGASNITALLGDKFHIDGDKALQRRILERVQDLENQGYQFEAAQASFELLLHEAMGDRPTFWDLDYYRCIILKRNGDATSTEAVVKLNVNGESEHRVASGDGPVNALDGALRKCLAPHYPELEHVHLADYKVRVVNPTAESAAKVRAIVSFTGRDPATGVATTFSTIGVNENIVDASWQALSEGFAYHLIETMRRV